MKICHLVPSLEERHGGPSKSVRALANANAEHGVATTILTTLEPGQTPPTAQADRAKIEVFRRDWPLAICRSAELQSRLAQDSFDCVHSHALWLRTLHYAHQAAQRTGAPLVISPRGMMSGWAWQHRRWRKQLAAWLVHPRAMQHAAGWHATSEDEANDIRARGFRQPVCVAPNGVELPTPEALAHAAAAWRSLCPAVQGRRVAVFYSRFHRKKRVRELVDLWFAEARDDWFLLLVGLEEEYQAAEINAWIAAAGGSERAAAFAGAGLPPPYALASLFVLPSHSENFGLVIAEALAAGVPALVTDQTPWHDLPREGAGWCVPWEKWPETLRAALHSDATEAAASGARGRAWVMREFTWSGAARRLEDFYRHLTHV